MKNLQKIFNKVAKHLLKQNKQSLIPRKDLAPLCAYRNPEGLKCAAGCLIPDDEYDEKYNSAAWTDTPFSERYTAEENCLISNLQGIHDYQPITNWRKGLIALAEYRDLKLIPELK